MINQRLHLSSSFISYNVLQFHSNLLKKQFSFLVSSLLISSLLFFFSFGYIPDSYAKFCEAVKYKDDGHAGYNIFYGSSQFGINDCIIGTNEKDIILGGDGQDFIRGKEGDDNLQGRYENDQLRGNDGDDNLQGGPGDDYLYGNDGLTTKNYLLIS